MPGYGVASASERRGLLPWSWAVERLRASHDYWLSTTTTSGAPHLMPVWGVWHEGALWFSSGLRSRKARNLARDTRCAVATDDAHDPVVLEGDADRVVDPAELVAFNDRVNAKYGTDYAADFYDPDVNGVWALRPTRAFGIAGDDFTGSPTRWDLA
jgi:hypothetical protein